MSRTIAELEFPAPAGAETLEEHVSCWEREDGTGIDLEVSYFADGQKDQQGQGEKHTEPGHQRAALTRSRVSMTHQAFSELVKEYTNRMSTKA